MFHGCSSSDEIHFMEGPSCDSLITVLRSTPANQHVVELGCRVLGVSYDVD